jgi:hypothetical protein
MAYGHAERNLALIHQLEAETMNLLGSLEQPDSEQPAWLQEIIRLDKQAFTSAGRRQKERLVLLLD